MLSLTQTLTWMSVKMKILLPPIKRKRFFCNHVSFCNMCFLKNFVFQPYLTHFHPLSFIFWVLLTQLLSQGLACLFLALKVLQGILYSAAISFFLSGGKFSTLSIISSFTVSELYFFILLKSLQLQKYHVYCNH